MERFYNYKLTKAKVFGWYEEVEGKIKENREKEKNGVLLEENVE